MAPLELDKMEPDESIQFLIKRTGRKDDGGAEKDSVEQLAKELDYLPLAMEQAGAYILQRKSSFHDYLLSYRARGLKLLEQSPPVTGKNTTTDMNRKTVATTWSLNFEQVTKASPEAADLLYVSAFLSHDNIPFEIISNGATELGPALSFSLKNVKTDPLVIDEVLNPLTQFSLIHRSPGTNMYNIHRMVQAVLRDRIDETNQRMWSERVVKAVNCAFPEVEFSKWHLCDRLLPHAKACSQFIDKYGFDFPEAANMLNGVGCYLRVRARYKEAHPFFIDALEIRKKIFGPESQEIAKSLNSLAGLYLNRGKYVDAAPLYKSALEIREKILKPDHNDVAKSLNNLAMLYEAQGKYDAAEPIFKRALEIREKVLNPDHPDLATSLNNLALLYKAQDKYDAAEPLYKRALEINEKVLDPDHPDLSTNLNNLALLYQDQGKYDAAEPLYKRALEICEKALDPDHPDLAASLNNLASLYKATGKYDAAEPLYKRALEICEKALDPDHPNLARNLNNLALLYQAQGKYAQVRHLLIHAVSIAKKSLGEEHPDFLLYSTNYVIFLQKINRNREAAIIDARLRPIREKKHKEKHK